ncbi:MAG: hypothetical protein MUP66_01500 [Candidatus Nanohaloarchaeota archaeon QJJ-5]|nr:hypothetical protein [Candidatus Nanohaloarchaeota archaeon QJJ-5]
MPVGYRRTVLAVVLFATVITAAVWIAAELNTQTSAPQPPELLLSADDERVSGLQGTYCWPDETGEQVCIEKIPPERLARDAPLINHPVTQQTRFDVIVPTYRQPDALSYRLVEENGSVVAEGDASRQFQLDGGTGASILVIEATWNNNTVEYLYQLQVEE